MESRIDGWEGELDGYKEKVGLMFDRMGELLTKLRDSKAYEVRGYRNFEAYAAARFGFIRQQADRLIAGPATLQAIGVELPEATPRPVRETKE